MMNKIIKSKKDSCKVVKKKDEVVSKFVEKFYKKHGKLMSKLAAE